MASEDRAAARLREIAAIVGCSIEAFYLPQNNDHEAAMTVELFRLWNGLTEPHARQRVLDRVRLEVGRQDTVRKAAG